MWYKKHTLFQLELFNVSRNTCKRTLALFVAAMQSCSAVCKHIFIMYDINGPYVVWLFWGRSAFLLGQLGSIVYQEGKILPKVHDQTIDQTTQLN